MEIEQDARFGPAGSAAKGLFSQNHQRSGQDADEAGKVAYIRPAQRENPHRRVATKSHYILWTGDLHCRIDNLK